MRIILIAIVIILVVVVSFLITPTTRELNNCFDQSAKRIEQFKMFKRNKEVACEWGKKDIVELNYCFMRIEKQKGMFLTSFVKMVAGLTRLKSPNNIEDIITEAKALHNTSCVDFPSLMVI